MFFLKKKVFCLLMVVAAMAGAAQAYGAEVINLDLFYDGANHKYSAQEIRIQVNGTPISDFVMPPVVLNDRTLVPARAVFEAMGAEVHWNADTKEVYVVRDADLVVLKIDQKDAVKNGNPFTLEVPPKIINDSTMIPVRAVAEALGCVVDWKEADRTVIITENGQGETSEEPSIGDGGQEGAITPSVPETPENPVTPPVNPVPPPNPVTPPVVTGPEITVQNVIVPSDGSGNFTITASGPIEKYQTLDISNNRLAVDIYNANMGIANDNITVNGSMVATSIRSAQNQVEPEKITRVVFDLTGQIPYTVTLSADKKSLLVSFVTQKNTITNLNFIGNGRTDQIQLTGSVTAPMINIQTLGNSMVLLDMPNAESMLSASYLPANSRLVTSIETLELSGDVVRVSVGLNAQAEYTVSTSGNVTTVTFSYSSVQNIFYDSQTGTITLNKQGNLLAAGILETDNYLEKKYVLTLPGDFEAVYGNGTMQLGGNRLEKLVIGNKDGNTTITIHETEIYAYLITEDDSHIYIKAVNPKEKYSKIVLIDPGHGGIKPGATINGLMEKDLTLAFGLKVISRLEADPNIKVYATRVTDAHVENADRAAMGNHLADVFISIHQNSVEGSTTPNGTEVLYLGHTNEVPGHLTSQIAAKTLLDSIIAKVGTTNRGIKVDPALIVLNQSKIPSVLIECGFMTNPDDMAKLTSEEYQNLYADAIYSAIVDMMNQYPVR